MVNHTFPALNKPEGIPKPMPFSAGRECSKVSAWTEKALHFAALFLWLQWLSFFCEESPLLQVFQLRNANVTA